MKNKSINQVSIINGEDGPTSVFIFGEAQKQSLKTRIRNAIYQSRRKRIEKRIAANPHTLAEVVQYAKNHYKVMGMGTTATLAMIYQNKIITAHVGDSRAYMIGDEIKQITKDHSYVQELVSRGEISPEMAKNHPKKNYITRAMGAEDTVKVDISIKPYNGETLVLCSDGLTNFVEDDEIRTYIKNKSNLQKSAEELVALANERGGGDNITIVALEREKCDNEQ